MASDFETIVARFERPNEKGFDFSEWKLPCIANTKAFGFSEDEIMEQERYLRNNSVLIWEMAREKKYSNLCGIVYGNQPEEMLEVKSVKVLDDMIMLITFSTGETRVFDATILKGEVFEPLKDEAVFKKVIVDHGVVTWSDGAIDCAPEYMYEHSFEYAEMV